MLKQKNQRSLDSIPKYKDCIIEDKQNHPKVNKTSSSSSVLKLPKINNHNHNNESGCNYNNSHHKHVSEECIDYKQNDSAEVSKLEEWTLNKPNKKSRTIINTHNISYLYRNSALSSSTSSIMRKKANNTVPQINKFMDVQLYIARVDNQLQKISELSYFSIYKNLQYCSGVYENSFNNLLKTISKYRGLVKEEVDQIQLKLQIQREEHLKKLQLLQENSNINYKVKQVREKLQEKQENLKPLKRLLDKIDQARIKVLKYSLSLGYDIRQQGLVWILKQLNQIPKPQEFPQFLSQKEIAYIITKFINEKQTETAQTQMKPSIEGKSINQAYQFVNRRKKRQLSFIKQSEQLQKVYQEKIKDYTKEKHNYLNEDTLQIAQSLQKSSSKPTKYEIIYNETVKKLNKITREKIHPKPKQNVLVKQENSNTETLRRKQKRKSTIIIEEFSKMLNLSITQSKKIDELFTKEEKQFQEILRQIRNEKYDPKSSRRGSLVHLDQIIEQKNKLRNPISVIGCLVGWKKAEKIIQQEMFSF